MARIKKQEVSLKSYLLIKQNYINSGRIINEQILGSRTNLFDETNKLIVSHVRDASIDLGKLSKAKFFSFIGLFHKNLYKNLLDTPDLMSLEITFSGMSRKKNKIEFEKMPIGTFFYNLDLNSAYWQIAYKLGYIDFDMFTKYQNDDEFKVAKRLCISFLSRKNRKNYYVNGAEHTIICDTGVLKQVYTNIRNTLYNIFTECSVEVEYIAYNIDSIYIKKSDLPAVKKIFDEMGLQYKLVLCQKTAQREYVYGNEKRIF